MSICADWLELPTDQLAIAQQVLIDVVLLELGTSNDIGAANQILKRVLKNMV